MAKEKGGCGGVIVAGLVLGALAMCVVMPKSDSSYADRTRSSSRDEAPASRHLLSKESIEFLMDPKNEEAIKEIGAAQREGFKAARPPGTEAVLRMGVVGRHANSWDAIFDVPKDEYRSAWKREMMEVPKGTRVTIIENDGQFVRLKMIDGPFAGTEGWTYYSYLKP